MAGNAAVSEQPIQVDREFAALIPPLAVEERQQLEQNLVEHGRARDPLIAWKNEGSLILLDGHNRYEICTRLGLPFSVCKLCFDDRQAAEDWIDRNQLGRRNLDARQMSLLRGRRYNRIKKKQGAPSGNDNAAKQSGQNVRFENTAEKLAGEHNVTEKTIRRDGQFAEAVEKLGIEQDVAARRIDASKHEIVAAAASLPEEPAPSDIEQAAETVKARPHVANNSGDNEWYTPKEFVDAARRVVGDFDLDPASNRIANKKVQAASYYTADDDGLEKDWFGVVWLNPPYNAKLIAKFSDKLCSSYEDGSVTAAIVLVNNATETQWFQAMLSRASAVCFPKGRIKFWHNSRRQLNPLQGQAFLYLGEHPQRFMDEFSSFGVCR
jgi:phage N-6-adenine-methyltransferase